MFNYNIIKISKNKLLLVNEYQLDMTICIIRDNQKNYSIKKEDYAYMKTKLIELSINTIINYYKIT